MLISGIQKFSVLDYPEKTSCIVFTPGCNFRCGYCHNAEFVLPEKIAQLRKHFIPESAFFHFLEQRKGLLDGVVVTGGEPTLMHDISSFISRIKSMDFLVKLDTNGSNPDILHGLISAGLLDYVAMDVKTSLEKYPELVGKTIRPELVGKSIAILKQANIDYEFRSTLIAEVHSDAVLHDMGILLNGSEKLFLQQFRPAQTLDPSFGTYHSFSLDDLTQIANKYFNDVVDVQIR